MIAFLEVTYAEQVIIRPDQGCRRRDEEAKGKTGAPGGDAWLLSFGSSNEDNGGASLMSAATRRPALNAPVDDVPKSTAVCERNP
ncbi:hypothetical protein MRX96_002062 [Rhipicephalus microplus]